MVWQDSGKLFGKLCFSPERWRWPALRTLHKWSVSEYGLHKENPPCSKYKNNSIVGSTLDYIVPVVKFRSATQNPKCNLMRFAGTPSHWTADECNCRKQVKKIFASTNVLVRKSKARYGWIRVFFLTGLTLSISTMFKWWVEFRTEGSQVRHDGE